MNTLTFLQPLETQGIEVIPVRRRPRKQTVGRHLFPILDLRTRSEALYEATPQAKPYAQHMRFIEEQFANDMPLQEEPILRAGPVTVFRGSVWYDGAPVRGSVHHRHNDDLDQWRDKVITFSDHPKTPFYPGVSAIIQAPGARNFFHWLIEVSPRLLSLRDYVEQGGQLDRIILFYDNPASFIGQVLERFYPDLAPLVTYCTRPICRLETGVFFTAVKLDSRWKTSMARFSEEIDEWLDARPRGPSRAILVSRVDAPTRKLVNEDLLLEIFAEQKLERVELGAFPLTGQMEVMADADFVIGVHGAGMTNLMFCRHGTTVIELTSTQYIRRCRSYGDISMHREFNYGLAILDQHGEQYDIVQNRGNDLELAPSQAGRLLDLYHELSGRTAPVAANA